MKDLLKVVNRAVKKNGGVFSYMRIDDGTVEANNGRIAIRATVPELDGVTATVPGAKLVAAVNACKGDIHVHTTNANLMVKSGSFSARIPLLVNDVPASDYDEGTPVTVPGDLPVKLATAAGFASEQFNGVLLRGSGIYGVSANAFIELAGEAVDGDVVIPLDTVADLAAIKELPTGMRVTDNAVIFDYASFQLRSQKVDKHWPDVSPFLTFDEDAVPTVPDGCLEAVTSVLPFADPSGQVTFTDGSVTCGEATVDDIDVADGTFVGDTLRKALSLSTGFGVYREGDNAEHIRARFIGDGVRGVLAGRA